jgi:hypothetical protein
LWLKGNDMTKSSFNVFYLLLTALATGATPVEVLQP